MRWKLLLRPSWLALTILVFAFAAACFTVLGPWQFDRHDERTTRNEAVRESLDAEPRPLTAVLPDGQAPDERSEWSRVTITGEYLADEEVLARLRTVQGEPAFEVLTPMRTTEGRVLVNRGYVRPGQGSRVPNYEAPPDGEVTVTARVRVDEPPPGDRDAVADSTGDRPQVYSASSELVTEATGTELRPGYFQLDAEQPGVVNPLPLPRTEAGPFFGYALQWLAFGVMVLLGWLYFTVRELRPGGALRGSAGHASPGGPARRRKTVAEMLAEDEAGDGAGDGPIGDPIGDPGGDPGATPEPADPSQGRAMRSQDTRTIR
ncbi:SURF1 family protein [Haloechinothrix alba]|uniref:SURF1 family cytochrome oxidase biogenesis protein n=1 Tax=Haloechinothrix alba TaxID=664784 RepID=UPI000B783D34|nr:SURF1 family cytochrome oxidase biogenesis protein [Haloechinothrix alba]